MSHLSMDCFLFALGSLLKQMHVNCPQFQDDGEIKVTLNF